MLMYFLSIAFMMNDFLPYSTYASKVGILAVLYNSCAVAFHIL